MEKFLIGALFLGVVYSLQSCSGSSTNTQTSDSTKAVAPARAPRQAVAIGKKLEWFSSVIATEDSLVYTWDQGYLYKELKTGLDLFKENYQNSSQKPLNNTGDFLLVAEVDTLFSKITYNPSAGQLSALRVYWGFDAVNNKILPVYEPLFLSADDGAGNRTPTNTGRYFVKYSGAALSEIDTAHKDTLTAYYRRNINIYHEEDGSFGPFKLGATFNEDVQSAVMTMQELLTMYTDNATAPQFTDTIVYRNVANYYIDAQTCKNHFVMYYNLRFGAAGYNFPTVQNFKNLAADFTQICPPRSCAEIQLRKILLDGNKTKNHSVINKQ